MPNTLAEAIPADRSVRVRLGAVSTPLAVASLGSILVIAADALPYYDGGSIDGSPTQSDWGLIQLFVLQFLAVAGTALLVVPSVRRLAAGVLVGAGLAGFLLHLQELGFFVTSRDEVSPGQGMMIGVLAAPLLLAAGLLAWPGASAFRRASTSSLVVRIAAAAGALGLLLAVVVPYGASAGESFALLYEPAGEVSLRWYALAPAGLAVVAAVIAFGFRSFDPQGAGGVLLTVGALSSLSFIFFSFTVGEGLDVRPGGYLGLAGGLLVAAAGGGALLLGRRELDTPTEEEAIRGAGVVEPGAIAQTTATRYLCAAAQLDERFARDVIRRVADEEHRAVAPSFGIDLGTALRHCYAARRRKRVRDVLLAALAVPAILLLGYRQTGAGIGYVLLIFVLAWVVVFTETWVSRYRIAARTLSRETYDPRAAPPAGDAVAQKIAALEEAERGNVTIYSGFRPFVGSGWDQGGWSFALNVAKGRKAFGNGERLDPKPFDAVELYEAVARDVEALELEGLVVEDRLYVDGQRIREDPRFVADGRVRRDVQLEPGEIHRLIAAPELENRVYRCIRISGWEGEFVLSIFLNFARAGKSLFAEARYFLLCPVRGEFLAVDGLEPRPRFGQRVKAMSAAVPRAAALLALALPRLAGEVRATIRSWRGRRLVRRRIRSDPSFDFGATTSIRELAQSQGYRRYFQQLDRDMTGKIVERQILDSILRFLEGRNIDISELEDRQTAILNNGVIVSGGTLKAESLAVGSKARARVTRVAQSVKQPAGRSAS